MLSFKGSKATCPSIHPRPLVGVAKTTLSTLAGCGAGGEVLAGQCVSGGARWRGVGVGGAVAAHGFRRLPLRDLLPGASTRSGENIGGHYNLSGAAKFTSDARTGPT